MHFPQTLRFYWGLSALLFTTAAVLHAQPEGAVSAIRQEGMMLTSLETPEHFIFRYGVREDHFDGTRLTMESQGGPGVGEPITGLHYMVRRPVVNGAGWTDEDARLLAAQFHGAPTTNFYLFKTIEGLLFYLPKEGGTEVVRMEYKLKNGSTVTVWARK